MANKYLALQGEKFDISKVTVVGSPTITSDGVASGFSEYNCIRPTYDFNNASSKTSWEVHIKFTYNISSKNQNLFVNTGGNYSAFAINTNGNVFFNLNNWSTVITRLTSKTVLVNNNTYNIIFKFDGNKYQIFINGVLDAEENNSQTFLSQGVWGIGTSYENGSYALPTSGSINLKDFKIYVDGQLVFQPVKPTYLIERRKEGYDPSKFTIVGSPTITEYGVMNVDGGANYVKTTKTFNLSEANSWDITTPIFVLSENRTSNASVIGADGIKDGLDIFVRASGQIQWMLFDAIGGASIFVRGLNSSWLNPNILYQLKYKFTGSKYVLLLSTNGGEFIEIDSVESSTKTNINSQFFIGFRGNTGFNGSINLPSISITIDDKEVFTGAKEQFYMLRR